MWYSTVCVRAGSDLSLRYCNLMNSRVSNTLYLGLQVQLLTGTGSGTGTNAADLARAAQAAGMGPGPTTHESDEMRACSSARAAVTMAITVDSNGPPPESHP